MEGISFEIQRLDHPTEIEMESSTTVAMISCGEKDRSIYALLVCEVKHLLNFRQSCLTQVPRSQNKASDRLASFTKVEGRTMNWVGSGPPDVLKIVVDEWNDFIIE
ncbi:hypothetical protein ZWY2020_025433 [Hordeum vulgare]|nr:hypothetical protein ZWY2020_025433 [Hordeum vulgare]